MRVGTKSVLWGVHCFAWHPVPVALAWRHLYGKWPKWHEWVAIFFHDFPGYWGKPNMDGPEGETHPERGAAWTRTIVNFFAPHRAEESYKLALYHSRFYAARDGSEPSALCYADKLSIHFEPEWFYLLRAHLSGEVFEYMERGPAWVRASSIQWLAWYKARVLQVVENKEKAKSRYV